MDCGEHLCFLVHTGSYHSDLCGRKTLLLRWMETIRFYYRCISIDWFYLGNDDQFEAGYMDNCAESVQDHEDLQDGQTV